MTELADLQLTTGGKRLGGGGGLASVCTGAGGDLGQRLGPSCQAGLLTKRFSASCIALRVLRKAGTTVSASTEGACELMDAGGGVGVGGEALRGSRLNKDG